MRVHLHTCSIIQMPAEARREGASDPLEWSYSGYELPFMGTGAWILVVCESGKCS